MPPLITLGQAKAALAQRLYDATEQFWSDAELTLYIQEAMRTWQALTSYWREEFTFSSAFSRIGGYGRNGYGNLGYGNNYITTGTGFFNITVLPGTVRPFTVTDQDLYQQLEYHLLEPLTTSYPLAWAGSAQFTMSDLMQAVERRRNEILETTGCTTTYSIQPADGSPRVAVPPTVSEIRRIAFVPTNPNDGLPTPMFQDDQWALQSFRPDYTVAPGGIPDIYSISTEPIVPDASQSAAITFDVTVPPGVPGSYELLTLQSGAALSTASPTIINIPNDWTWVVKFGALADLLGRESNAKDLPRAKHCEARYQQGIALLTHAPALLAMRSNNVPLQIDSITAADNFNPEWEGATGPPTMALTAGLNLFTLSASSGGADTGWNEGGYNEGGYGGGGDTTPVSLTAMMVSNAPVPFADSQPVLVTLDVLDTLLDYSQYLAMLKCGGAEFEAAIPLFNNFLNRAALSWSRLGQQGEFQTLLWERSQMEEDANPRYASASPEGGNG